VFHMQFDLSACLEKQKQQLQSLKYFPLLLPYYFYVSSIV